MEEKRRDKQQHKKNQSNHNHTAKLWNRQKMSRIEQPILFVVVLLIIILVFNLSFSFTSLASIGILNFTLSMYFWPLFYRPPLKMLIYYPTLIIM